MGQEPAVVLPPALSATTREQAGALLEQVGQLQRHVAATGELDGVAEAIVSRIEGAALFYLAAGADPVVVFDQAIAPISEWALPLLMEGPEATRTAHVIFALREKYQYLNPNNT